MLKSSCPLTLICVTVFVLDVLDYRVLEEGLWCLP